MKYNILSVGNISMKTSYNVPAFKSKGISYADEFRIEPYGNALISSLIVSRLGGEGIICSKLGNDLYGNRLKQFCLDEGVNTRFLNVSKTVPTSSVTDFEDGEYQIVYNGASGTITDDEIEDALVSYPDIVIADMSADSEVCRKVFEFSKKYNVKTIASFDGLKHIDEYEYISGCEAIIVDYESAYTLTGVEPKSPDMCVKACLKISYNFSPKYVILRLGERGSLSYDGKHCEFHPGIECSENCGTLSELAFIAAFSLDYAKNNNAGHACMAGNIVSAITELKAKSVFELPNAEEVNAFVAEHGLKI